MPVKRTYVCDCCGRVVKENAKHYVMTVESFNYRTLVNDGDYETYIYCCDCTEFMWKAIRAIPRLREAREANNAKPKPRHGTHSSAANTCSRKRTSS